MAVVMTVAPETMLCTGYGDDEHAHDSDENGPLYRDDGDTPNYDDDDEHNDDANIYNGDNDNTNKNAYDDGCDNSACGDDCDDDDGRPPGLLYIKTSAVPCVGRLSAASRFGVHVCVSVCVGMCQFVCCPLARLRLRCLFVVLIAATKTASYLYLVCSVVVGIRQIDTAWNNFCNGPMYLLMRVPYTFCFFALAA